MEATHATQSYRVYWLAWLALLAITLTMVLTGARPVLIVGMLAKAGIILWVYMHLMHERRRLLWTVLLGIFLTAAFLVGLMVPDGRAM